MSVLLFGLLLLLASCQSYLDMFQAREEQYIIYRENDGSGVFIPRAFLNSTDLASCVTAADFNGDGWIDVYAPPYMIFGGEDGFNPVLSNYVDIGTCRLSAIDLDLDGDIDAVVSYYGSPVRVYVNDGNGNLTYAFTGDSYSMNLNNFFIFMDLNGDNYPDFVGNIFRQNVSLEILLNEGGQALVAVPLSVPPTPPENDMWYALAASVLHPNHLYLATNFGSLLYFYSSLGDGAFELISTLTLPTVFDYFLAVADFDGDGFEDVVVDDANTNGKYIFFGNGTGSFENAILLASNLGNANVDFGAADVNNDGRLDIVLTDSSGDFAGVYIQGDNRQFTVLPSPEIDEPCCQFTNNAALAVFSSDVCRNRAGDIVVHGVVHHCINPALLCPENDQWYNYDSASCEVCPTDQIAADDKFSCVAIDPTSSSSSPSNSSPANMLTMLF